MHRLSDHPEKTMQQTQIETKAAVGVGVVVQVTIRDRNGGTGVPRQKLRFLVVLGHKDRLAAELGEMGAVEGLARAGAAAGTGLIEGGWGKKEEEEEEEERSGKLGDGPGRR